MYTQGSEPWGSLLLGSSTCICAQYGCLATDMALALTLAGYSITPGDFITKMNSMDGFTADGLLIWAKVAECYPQFHLDQGNQYTFQEGSMGHLTHWVLKTSGTVYDPLFGEQREPTGFHETSYHRTATIDAPKIDVITTNAQMQTFTPFVTDLNPSQKYSDEVKRVQQFLSWQDCLDLTKIGKGSGYYGPLTESAIKLFKSKNGITINGIWDNDARGIANGILLIHQSTNPEA